MKFISGMCFEKTGNSNGTERSCSLQRWKSSFFGPCHVQGVSGGSTKLNKHCIHSPRPRGSPRYYSSTVHLNNGSQCLHKGGEAGRNYPGPGVRKGLRGPTVLHMFLSLWVLSLFIVQISRFIQIHSHCANDFFFRLSVKIFSRSALAAGPEKSFSSVPEPAVGCPFDTVNILADIKGRSSLVRELRLCHHNDCEELHCRVCCTV